jgi:DNA polymerase III subunit gamma/tau
MSYQVIARKWRPQSFEEIVGQKHVTETLANAIRTGRVAHAYIFSGVRGVGKTTTARVLAKALNCEHGPTPQPCNQCDACREIAAGTSLDVIEIDAASNRGIDQIRELREMVRYAPASSRYKVVILDEAHQLTPEASNALLKTLEEPPERVIFVLATTQPEDLTETIRSRAQHFHFRSLAFDEIVEALERIAREERLTVEPGALAVMARAAEGSLRDGLSLLEQARVYCGENITDRQVRELLGVVPEEVLDELVEAIAARSAEHALKLAHRLIAEGQNAQYFCREAIRHFRNLLVARIAGSASELIAAQAGERPRLGAQAARFSEEDLTRSFQILLSTDDDLRRKPDPRLHLEMGLLRLVNAARLGSLEELAAELRGGASPPSPGSARGEPSRASSGVPRDAGLKPSATGRPDAPAIAPAEPAAAASPAEELSGIDPEKVEAIRAEVAEQKFLASLVEHVTRWEAEGDELRLYFPPEGRALAEMLQARDPMEKLRAIVQRVTGRPLRVCVKLRAMPAPAKPGAARSAAEVRAQFEKDATVRAMLERFGGQISNVKVPGGN